MGEIVQIHVGQAGVQIANACWELYCLEYGIKYDGKLCGCACDPSFKNFFYNKESNKAVARAVLVDSDPSCIEHIRAGPCSCLYDSKCLIAGKEDSGCVFPRGYSTIGSELIDVTMEAIRMVTESCSNIRGFLIYRSVGGGTGSGLGNLIEERLNDEYGKVSKMEFIVFPSPSVSPLTVEPYNAIMATHLNMDLINCSFILDNEALYDICATQLKIRNPKYRHINRIIAQVATNFTTAQRFGCHSGISFAEYQTNLVPYPRIHYPIVSYAPFFPATDKGCCKISTDVLTNSCFEPCNQLVRCCPTAGKFMSCLLLYRGNITASCIDSSIEQLRKSGKVRFVDWQPTDFKVGINGKHPFVVPCGCLGCPNKSLLTLSGNTAIRNVWYRLIKKFNNLYCIRAYIHHYTCEGVDEDCFNEALEDISTLVTDYKEVESCLTGNINGCTKKCSTQQKQCKHSCTSCRMKTATQCVEGGCRKDSCRRSNRCYEQEEAKRCINFCALCGGDRDICGCNVVKRCLNCGGNRNTCGCSRKVVERCHKCGGNRDLCQCNNIVFQPCLQCGGNRDTCGCGIKVVERCLKCGYGRDACRCNVVERCLQCGGNRDTCGCGIKVVERCLKCGYGREACRCNVVERCLQCGGNRATCGCGIKVVERCLKCGYGRDACRCNLVERCLQCGGNKDTCICGINTFEKCLKCGYRKDACRCTVKVVERCLQCGGNRDTCGCTITKRISCNNEKIEESCPILVRDICNGVAPAAPVNQFNYYMDPYCSDSPYPYPYDDEYVMEDGYIMDDEYIIDNGCSDLPCPPQVLQDYPVVDEASCACNTACGYTVTEITEDSQQCKSGKMDSNKFKASKKSKNINKTNLEGPDVVHDRPQLAVPIRSINEGEKRRCL